MPAVRKNKEQAKTSAAYNIVMGTDMNEEEMIAANRRNADQMSNVIDIRYDENSKNDLTHSSNF